MNARFTVAGKSTMKIRIPGAAEQSERGRARAQSRRVSRHPCPSLARGRTAEIETRPAAANHPSHAAREDDIMGQIVRHIPNNTPRI
jgi:hypothetical protein